MYGIRMGNSLPILICVASPREREALFGAFGAEAGDPPGRAVGLAPGVVCVETGVGPTAAGVSAAAALGSGSYSAVVCMGIAGAYPGSGIEALQMVLSTRSVLAGEGRAESDRFVGLAEMGFGPFAGAEQRETSPELVGALSRLADHRGPIATVPATSGSAALAAALADRTGAVAEAMEGAAVHLACERFGVPFAELRVVSNVVGDRGRHPWKLEESLARVGPLGLAAAEALRG